MNEKLKTLLQALVIPSLIWIVLAYSLLGIIDKSDGFGVELFVAIFLISYIGLTGLMYILIKDSGFIFSKKKK
jgi:hypothetical protein